MVPGAQAHHVDAIAQVNGLFDRMGHEEDGRLGGPPQRRDQVLHVPAGLRIEGPERLVHEDDPRAEDERAGDGHPLPHAAGKLVRILLGVGRHVQPHALDPLAAELLPLATAARRGTPARR